MNPVWRYLLLATVTAAIYVLAGILARRAWDRRGRSGGDSGT